MKTIFLKNKHIHYFKSYIWWNNIKKTNNNNKNKIKQICKNN